MNGLTASMSLLSVSFFWSIQYIFYKNIPVGISSFAFLALTNAIGFLLLVLCKPKTLFRFTVRQIKSGFFLGALLFAFNVALLAGCRIVDSTSSAFLASAYFVFVPAILLLQKKHVSRNDAAAVVVTLVGVLFGTGYVFSDLFSVGVLYILLADILFAVYVVLVEKVASEDDVFVLSVGQMGFVGMFSLIGWAFDQPSSLLSLPVDMHFWIDVIVIAVFVRGYSTVMQIYAQRYVSAISTSLIFSTEIVFSVIVSLFLPALLGDVSQHLTIPKVAGCLLIILGVAISNNTFSGLKPWRRKPMI